MGEHVGHLGLDLGGTKLEAVALAPGFSALSDPRGAVLSRRRIATEAAGVYEHILDRAAGLLGEVRREAGLGDGPVTIGAGLPGVVSPRTGLARNSNTTSLNGRPVQGDLSARLGQAVETTNDANAFALAEATWGAGRGASSVFGVILGTGVGGGIVLGGRVVGGAQGIAGEWGHTELEPGGRPCYCGRRGCVETYLSGPALGRSLAEAGIPMDAAAFDAAWRAGAAEGDGRLRAVAEAYLSRFGRALSTVVNILDPEILILGGGMGRWPALYTDGFQRLAEGIFGLEAAPRLLPPLLGDAAGVFGAALLGAGG